MKPVKIVVVIGARPQFVKAAALAAAHRKSSYKKKILFSWVHTGQHYDYQMSGIFFKQLRIPKPKYHLGVGSSSQSAQTGLMMQAFEKVLIKEKSSAVLVFGDTNSTIAGALVAAKLSIPVIHVEAGLRSFNRSMPEEINRVVTDHLSELLFCPTAKSVFNLRREGISRGVCMVGDVMSDILLHYKKQNISSTSREDYYLSTIHRNTNTDSLNRLKKIFTALSLLDKNVIFPMHPRTKNILARESSLRLIFKNAPNLKIIEPLSYLDMIQCEANAAGIVTDSGGVQKEAAVLGIPCVTLRSETEWGETVDLGLNTLCEPDALQIIKAFQKMKKNVVNKKIAHLYGRGDASIKILNIIYRHFRGVKIESK